MNSTQSIMLLFEIIDEHITRTGCQTCMNSIARALYHAQTDENVRDKIDYLMHESPNTSDMMEKEDEKSFRANIAKIEKETKKWQKE